ncbi:MarR family winged helix-turn-helix transcriptional regulator [Actinoplanes sp. NPDC026619]|uniref:MarR family winged helix-turn-helix transcriptional regulator n=1 Tax=Actinoplanes sp. NPDC026619 TaxID=3155798 RepID=UPI0033D61358
MQASQDDPQRTVAALMAASRAFVGITARSLATMDEDVTLPQFRAMMVLATRGPQRAADISAELNVTPSTGTRMCERLVRKGFVRRTRTTSDRRVVRLRLTAGGRTLVDEVVSRRRDELAAIVGATAGHWTPAVTAALSAFAEAAGEAAEQEWWLGFAADDDVTA